MTGVPEDAVRFLADLAANNDSDWFEANRARYRNALWRPARAFEATVTDGLQGLTGLPHRARMRPLRRGRRAAAKGAPFHTELWIAFLPRGGGPAPPGWHFRLGPEHLVLGAGIPVIARPRLQAFRARLDSADGAVLADRLAALAGAGVRLDEPALKRVPRDFDRLHPRADLLRRKGLCLWLAPERSASACRSDLADRCLAGWRRLHPVFDWLLAPGW